MRYTQFRDRVLDKAPSWFPKVPESDANAADAERFNHLSFTIGSAEIGNSGLLIAIARFKHIPSEEGLWEDGLEKEALRTNWCIATAPDDFRDEDTLHSASVHSVVGDGFIDKLHVGHVPMLPEGAMITLSATREFYPTILAPDLIPEKAGIEAMSAQLTRYQIVIPPRGIAEL